jgi:hypothetical protein
VKELSVLSGSQGSERVSRIVSKPGLASAALIADWIVPCVHWPAPTGLPTVKMAACAVAPTNRKGAAVAAVRRRGLTYC